jgi:hypothetical protein
MEKIFEVVLKDDEVLAVSYGNALLGVIIRPSIEKILALCDDNRFEKGEDILSEKMFQETDIIIGVDDIMETTFKVGYATEIIGEELIRMGYEDFNLEIVKILI